MKAVFRNSCTLILLVSSATVARSTTFIRMSIEQLAQQASLIVRARCTGSMVESRGGEIWTITFFEVTEMWKGQAPRVARVRLLGGRTTQFTSHVAGVPHFRVGEDVILFLDAQPGGEYSILTWQQGTFRVHRNPAQAGDAQSETVSQDTGGYQSMRPTSATGTPLLDPTLTPGTTLQDFHQRIQSVLTANPRLTANGVSR
jgi:hypothetical protein